MESPNQEERWNAWGYPEFTVEGTTYSVLGGAKPFVRSSTLERDSALLVIELSIVRIKDRKFYRAVGS